MSHTWNLWLNISFYSLVPAGAYCWYRLFVWNEKRGRKASKWSLDYQFERAGALTLGCVLVLVVMARPIFTAWGLSFNVLSRMQSPKREYVSLILLIGLVSFAQFWGFAAYDIRRFVNYALGKASQSDSRGIEP